MKVAQKKVLSLVLAAAMAVSLLSVSAFASWTTYSGNNNHNAVVDSASTSTNPDITKITLTKNGSGWDGVDNVPVMQTVNGVTYAYVLYDGYTVSGANGGGRLAKINCNTGKEVWNKQVTTASGFQLSTPLLVEDANNHANDVLYIGASSASQVLAPLGSSSWTVSGGTVSGSTVTVASGATATLTQSGYNMSSTPTNRVALGIYVGTSATTNASATVTWNVNGTTGSKTFASSDLLQEGTTGRYYFYVNENIGTVSAATNNSITFTVKMTGGSGVIEYAEQYQQTGAIQKVTGLNATSASGVSNTAITAGTAISGQINTPITTDGTYLYFGTWSGGTNAGAYYQISKDGSTVNTFTPDKYGFYWAGAVAVGDYIYFGSDYGRLYYAPISNISAASYIDLTGTQSDAGNVRSTVMYDGTNLYFTSQGGYLWCCSIHEKTHAPSVSWTAELGATSTSTPTKVGDRIYVGYYSGFSAGGVQCVSASGAHTVNTVATGFPVQSSIVVKGTGSGTDYVYFVTNAAAGAGYCYSYNGSTGTKVWATTGDNYALGGMAIADGYAVFGNDKDNLYIVK